MFFEKVDQEKAKKLGLSEILDLALFIPTGYEDTRLSNSIVPNTTLTLRCENIGKKITPKTAIYTFRLLDFKDKYINAVYFSPKRYQQNLFATGESVCLHGKSGHNSEIFLSHPKKVSEYGKITPIYVKGMQNKTAIAFVKKYLTLQNLKDEGLDDDTANEILKIHFDPLSFDTKEPPKNIEEALKTVEIYRYLKGLSLKKTDFPAKPLHTAQTDSFLNALPYKITDDQKNAVEAIKNDLSQNRQARRVIVGDVGCGKTTVILALAAMVGKNKTALLAPTSILARQIYEEATKYLPLKTVLVTQSSNAKDDEIQNADFLIGTHALLYKKLPACAAVAVDEQHRFGTNQRRLIAALVSDGKDRPHYFQFSATPIPRTQALIEASLAELTLIKQMPIQKEITTNIVSKDGFSALYSHIKEEVEKGNQAAIIYPLVEKSDNHDYLSIEEAEGFWTKRFQNVYVTHGKDSEKEAVFEAFRKDGTVIVSTTVMEVGISLPRLSVIVIVGAERLGLATLHQLRGRVARNSNKGWCYLYTNNPQNERLKKFAVTKSGFEIAELDLEFRDSGDLLVGKEQSGKMFRWFDFKNGYDAAKKAKWMLEQFLKGMSVK